MTPLERLRLEKAAADCGFEMTPLERDDGLELRSARFPESVAVRVVAPSAFEVVPSSALLLNEGAGSVTVQGYEALYSVLRTAAAHARTLPNRVAEEFRSRTSAMPKSTEAERLVVQRVGQDVFRAALLDYWQGRCCVTGLDVPQLLRASHIRPWAQCETDEQRLDVFNGLLLAPHLDALFDAGLMTFDTDGLAMVSGTLSADQRAAVGLQPTMRARGLRAEHQAYLDYHRRNVWVG